MRKDNANNKEVTIDDLAIMIGKGFSEVNGKIDVLGGRMDKMDGRMDKMEGRMDKMEGRMGKLEQKVDDGFLRVNARLDTIERDIKDLEVVTRSEFDDLMERMKYVEMKLGIESGK